jgi:hypothetical protein
VLSFNLAGTKFTSSKFPRKEFILSGSVKSEISQFDDTYALSQLKIGSSEWIKKLLFGCRIKTEWKFFNIPEINEYNILNIHFYISTEIEILSFDQQISSVYIFCKQENGKLHIFDQK